MNYWRMSFRCGNHGYEMWRHCKKHGVAAISYDPLDDFDLSKYEYNKPRERWADLNSSQKASLRRLAYEMIKGDVIYVKQGQMIVGKGTIRGGYCYNLSKRVEQDSGYRFPHQIPVNWDPSFYSIRILLGAEQLTVKKLAYDQVRQLEHAAKISQKTAIEQIIITEGVEGELNRGTHIFRRRNRALIAAKLSLCSENPSCEVCGFRFKARYGTSVKEALEVHHCNPMSESKGVRVTSVENLAVLCPNCHRALHTTQPAMIVEALKQLVR